jgi:uncharacterized coiled-coil DUF342 family protein
MKDLEELKNQIISLEEKNEDLKDRIEELEDENLDLNHTINQLNLEIQGLPNDSILDQMTIDWLKEPMNWKIVRSLATQNEHTPLLERYKLADPRLAD